MAANKRRHLAGVVIGLTAVGAAVYSVFFVDWTTEAPPADELVRPVKTMVIDSPYASVGRKYPGRVLAHQRVDLAFQVAGPLIEFTQLFGGGSTNSSGDCWCLQSQLGPPFGAVWLCGLTHAQGSASGSVGDLQ